jgi:undecaprenyl-diphosphatase
MTAGWNAVLLGIVQGLTEFLPISSDGHLTMARAILGLAPDLPFEVLVHGATLIAILVYFRRRIVELARGRSPRYVAKLALTVVPAVVVALTLREWIDAAFATPAIVVVTLAVTGTALLSLYLLPAERWAAGHAHAEPSWATAWWMGCAQALAILPGISRSGSTIVVGMWLGLAPAAAAEFSFLMGIPAIAGALVLEGAALEAAASNGAAASYAVGAIAAFATGLLAIHLVFRLLASQEFRWFGFYCWGAALAFGAWLWLR